MQYKNLSKFYRGKQVLITGHSGFKGQWLALILSRMGAKVSGISLNDTIYSKLFLANNLISDTKIDITDYAAVEKYIKSQEPDIIFHLAAVTLVGDAAEDPLNAIRTNALGTANILEATRQTKSVKALICVTTDKVYADSKGKARREGDALGGKELYAASKSAADMFTSAYYDSYFCSTGVGIASARAGNVIGGGDANESRLIPHIIDNLVKKNPVVIKNPKHTRPWQFVLEPLYGYLLLAFKLTQDSQKYSGAWNFGPNERESKKVHQVVEKIMEVWGRKDTWTLSNLRQYKETEKLKLNSAKARKHLSWKSRLSANQSILLTVEWYKRFFAGEDMTLYSNYQIDEYEKYLG